MRRLAFLILAVAAGAFMACGPEVEVDDEDVGESRSAAQVDTPAVRIARGRNYVLNNGTPLDGTQEGSSYVPYVSCGIPQGVVWILKNTVGVDVIGTGPKLPASERPPAMRDLPYYLTTVKRPNDVEVLSSSCLLCHASKLGDSVIVGLPNSSLDFSQDETMFGLLPFALDGISMFLTPEENEELVRYRRVSEAGVTAPRPDTRGVNSADLVFGIIASHRDKATLEWTAEQNNKIDLHKEAVYTDVPAWWNMKFRDRMFYSGVGRGRHARIMMGASLLCVENTTEAAAIDAKFDEVEEFIKSIKPPLYTEVAKRSIDMTRADRGAIIYRTALPNQNGKTCLGCHGDPRPNSTVNPAPWIPLSVVGTDPVYATNVAKQAQPPPGVEQKESAITYYFNYFNDSWFGRNGEEEGRAARIEQPATPGYSPPSLAGIWATAPYFHNGSVPTLEGVLKPSRRPTIYRRDFDSARYDFGGPKPPPPPIWDGRGSGAGEVGWKYEPVLWKADDTTVYDTRRPGYGNQGHTFAADLNDAQRRDLIEFLKTL